jgi:hypothetical protein
MRCGRTTWAVLVAATVLTVAGCGGRTTGEVSGTVTFDGKPVEAGGITFVPVDGKSPTTGGVLKDGQYKVLSVPVGAAKVVINGTKVIGKKKLYDSPDSPEMPLATELLPDKYNKDTELRFDVNAGQNQKNFDLHSK